METGVPRQAFLHGELTYKVLGCAYEVHKQLGPGLLESAYRTCLCHELQLKGLGFQTECPIGVQYKEATLPNGYRADVIVEGNVLVEIKSVEHLLSIHEAQLLTYLRLSGIRVGLLINFNVTSLKAGIRRFIK